MPAISLLVAMALASEPATSEITYDRVTGEVRTTATFHSGDDRLEIGCTPFEVRRLWVRLRSHRWLREGNVFNGDAILMFRFDEQPPIRMMWSVRERAAMLVGLGRVERFVRRVVDSRQLIVRARGPEGRRYDITFSTEDARDVIGRALEACGNPLRRRLG